MAKTFNYLLIILVSIIFSCTLTRIDNPEISEEELFQHINFLASDSLKGRFPGTPEGKIAAEYIEAQLKGFGLKLLGEKGFQYFDVFTSVTAGENNSLSFEGFDGEVNKDFAPFPFSGNVTLRSAVVFAGYGFDIKKINWDDYADHDVSGKWVMLLRGDPEIDSLNSSFAEFSDDRDKVMLAKDKGAAGVIFVSGVEMDTEDQLVSMELRQGSAGIPAIHIKREIANMILKNSGTTIEDLEEILNKTRKSNTFKIDLDINASTDVSLSKVKTQNVIALLEGNDPVLKNEFILIGTHYDHLGIGGRGTSSRVPDTIAVHYGADDNASGVSAMIELAEKLAANKENMLRSIIFMAFGAEEMGIVGSKFFTENPLVDLSRIKVMINIDMVGRLKEDSILQIGGTGTSLEGESILKDYAIGRDFNLALSPEGYGPSDHASFYGKDIPVFFFSTGAHIDYHTPGDNIEKINFKGLKSISDYIFNVTMDIANRDSYLTFQEAGPKAISRSRGRLKVSLGIMPDVISSENDGLMVEFVTKGKPAYYGGMKKGDVIITINGQQVNNIYDYMYRLSKLKQGQTITVEVRRNDKIEVLIIQL